MKHRTEPETTETTLKNKDLPAESSWLFVQDLLARYEQATQAHFFQDLARETAKR